MQESAWIAATLAGDTSAFANIVNAYQRAVYNLAYRMLGNAEEAADAAQEAFIRAYTQLGRYDDSRAFAGWLFSIAAHYCIDVLRKRRSGQLDLAMLDVKIDDAPGPEEEALVDERRSEVRALLDQLPTPYRIVVVLRYWYDMPCEEIAQVSGLTVSAVKTRLHRARALLVQAAEGGSKTSQPLAIQSQDPATSPDLRIGENRGALQRSAQAALRAPRRSAHDSRVAGLDYTPYYLRLVPTVCAQS